MSSSLSDITSDIKWIDSEEGDGDGSNEPSGKDSDIDSASGETPGTKLLIRQDSIHDLTAKTLTRQNSLHEGDLRNNPNFNLSNERSLSWDNYVENYTKNADEILRGLLEIREQLRASSDDEEDGLSDDRKPGRGLSLLSGYSTDISTNDTSKKCFSLSIESHHHYKPNLSKTSSKNTRCSSDVSDFSFESNWNSKQSFSLETYQSHPNYHGSVETSSGIKSISEDTTTDSLKRVSSGSSFSRQQDWIPNCDSSDDPYEYDDEIPMDLSSIAPSVDEELIAEGKIVMASRLNFISH